MATPFDPSSALVLFSAGQDSTTCLAWALTRFARVETVGFAYGQRHAVEMDQRPVVLAALRALDPVWAVRLGVDTVIDVASFGALADSALTADRAIAMQANGLPSTFVPGRNLVFLTYAAALAYRGGQGVLVGGMCETDFAGYPDCRRDTLDAMQAALSLGLDVSITVETPLMTLTKAETWALAEGSAGRRSRRSSWKRPTPATGATARCVTLGATAAPTARPATCARRVGLNGGRASEPPGAMLRARSPRPSPAPA